MQLLIQKIYILCCLKRRHFKNIIFELNKDDQSYFFFSFYVYKRMTYPHVFFSFLFNFIYLNIIYYYLINELFCVQKKPSKFNFIVIRKKENLQSFILPFWFRDFLKCLITFFLKNVSIFSQELHYLLFSYFPIHK